MINLKALSQINKIIEQDKISSTYKFALLKSTIDACQRYDNLIRLDDKHAHIPFGLVVEGWIFDYLPFVFNRIRQQNSGNVLNAHIEEAYNELFGNMHLDPNKTTWEDAYEKIYSDYLSLNFNPERSRILLKLSKRIASTIAKMPMKFSGDRHYEIYTPDRTSFGRIHMTGTFNRQFLIESFDTFRISRDHYFIFRYMGQSLYGTSTIARRWRETTYALNRSELVTERIDSMIFKTIFADRNTNVARQYLPNDCTCVWSGRTLRNGHYDIDHVLPYSVWFNNDLWNLLPADSEVNSQKSDKIPSPELIKQRKEHIIHYWNIYEEKARNLFDYQIRTSLGKKNIEVPDKNLFIEAMREKADYLINERGYTPFDLNL